ncbi:MAG: hypothetical protein QOK49_4387 [Baekduia sp.]|jgi:hypothetical protein|nr:hypothetical protein [Baekduia sp.]
MMLRGGGFRTIGLQQLAVCALGFGVAGGALGSILRSPAPPPATDVVVAAPAAPVTAGELRVTPSAGWKADPAADLAVAGLRGPRAVTLRGPRGAAVIGQATPAGPDLLPAGLRKAAGARLGRSVPIRFAGGVTAVRYPALPVGPKQAPLDVYAVPTTHDVVVLACPRSDATCPALLSTLRLRAGRVLTPGPDAAMRAGLDDILVRLARTRRDARDQIAFANNPADRTAAAHDVAAAYRTAASELSPLSGGTPRSHETLGLLRRLARDHDQLAASAATRDPAAFARDGHTVTDDEIGLQTLLGVWHDAT